jgi:LysM repeat protein
MTILSRRVRYRAGLIPCSLTAMMLGACAHQPKAGPRPVLVQPIGNEQQIEDVVGALKQGDTRRARKLLKSLAKRDPANRKVAVLLEGLEGDPVKLLGAASYSYRVESGEQLTTLAQRYLGNSLKFYLLARYNGLKTDNLRPGQVLRIPGTAPAPKPRAEVRPEPQPERRPDQRREPRAPAPAARSTAPVAPPTAATSATNPVVANRMRAQALAALNRGAVPAAVVLLRRARALNPANEAIRTDLARAERLFAAVKARR